MAIHPLPEDRNEWLAMRRKYIGGSEIAALFGAQAEYQNSPFSLWHIKAGLIPEPDVGGARIRKGNRFEATIAEEVSEQEGWVLKPGVFAVDDHCEGMSASLDRVILPTKEDVENGFIGPGALEIKLVDWMQFKIKWIDGEPPAHIMIQLQHQLACTGYKWGAIGVCVGLNDTIPLRYHARPRMHESIRVQVAKFWQSIADKKPPQPDGFDSTTAALRALYPDPVDDECDFGPDMELSALCAKLNELTADRLAHAKEEEALKNIIKSRLGNYQRGRIDGPAPYRISLSVGKDTPDRPAKPGEIIRGRRGSVRLTVSPISQESSQTPKRKKAA